MLTLFYLIVFLVMFYFIVYRPQQKRVAAHQELIEELKVGDEIITAGGIYGIIKSLEEDFLILSVAENVTLKISKRAVAILNKKPEKE
ncbi:MAG: preprotein translocase subunit YajC, partial [Actinobacteria bacterium]|nr:preprotein translocase subunit YajC [Actinomycetota bacterium]